MLFFLDTEFNGWGGELISIALVPEDDNEPHFYEEITINHFFRPWVQANVVPHLDEDSSVDRVIAAHRMSTYLCGYRQVTIVADWPEDFKHFCNLIVYGPGACYPMPRLSMKLAQPQDLRTDDKILSEIPHHALYDAIALRRNWIGGR